MIVIFSHELIGSPTKAEDVQHFILDQAELPSNVFRAIENLELKSSEVRQDISTGRVYGRMTTRSIYFAWDLPFAPAIGWQFCPPATMDDFSGLATITDIYFGSGDVLLCEYS